MTNAMPKTVLFLCTANYYRSRFSEYLFNARAAVAGLSWRATSRGLMIWMADGQGPISIYAVDRLTKLGVAMDGSRLPVQLSRSDLDTADLVIAMKRKEHHAMMQGLFPDWADRIEYWHVDDMDCGRPEESLPLCQVYVERLVRRLAADDSNPASSAVQSSRGIGVPPLA